MSTFSPLYTPLVRPHLACAMQACSSSLIADRIQRLETEPIKGFLRLLYEEWIWGRGSALPEQMSIPRWLQDACKMFSGRLDLDPSLFFISPVCQAWEGNRLMIFKVLCRKASFVTAPSVNSFKRQLDSTWSNLFLEVLWVPLPTPSVLRYLYHKLHLVTLLSPTITNAKHNHIYDTLVVHSIT